MFIKRVYASLIDGYFKEASFVKPTGDGLLIIIPYTESTLQETVAAVVADCLSILVDFSSFTTNDPMVNFEVPQKIGIGFTRGSTCCLHSGRKVLDYSGRVLNLASRLMDLARPSGIVFDSSFGIELMPEHMSDCFSKETVYVRGIAESEPIEVYYTHKYTTIPLQAKQPLDALKWRTVTSKTTLKEIREIGETTGVFCYELPTKPADPKQIKVKVEYPMVVKGRRREGLLGYDEISDFAYSCETGSSEVELKFDALAKMLDKAEVKDSWSVEIRIFYPQG